MNFSNIPIHRGGRSELLDKSFSNARDIMIKASIILPVYNVEKYLPRCLDSLLNQTLNELEFICIDDGSTDKSLDILRRYARKDSRFIIVTQENQGSGVARNKGLQLAKGKYIAFLDPDDWIETNAMECLFNKAEEENAEVVLFNYNIVSQYNKVYASYADDFLCKTGLDLKKVPYFYTKDLENEYFFVRALSMVWEKFYSRKFIEKHNIHFSTSYVGEDNLFCLMAYYFADKIHYLNKHLYNYYQRSNSVVHKYSAKSLTLFTLFYDLQKFVFKYLPERREEFINCLFSGAFASYSLIPFYNFAAKRNFKRNAKEFFGEEYYLKYLSYMKARKKSFKERLLSFSKEYEHGLKYNKINILGFVIKIERPIRKNVK